MEGERLVDAQQAAISFLDLLSVEDQMSIISFANDARLDQPLTYNRQDARRAIAGLRAGGGTQIHSGIRTATDELTGEQHNPAAQQVLILLTDAEAKGGDEAAIAEATAAKSKNIRIITIGLGEARREQIDLFRQIASTDNDISLSPSSEDLGAIYATISTVIRSCDGTPTAVATTAAPTPPATPSAPATTTLLISTETPTVTGPQEPGSNVP
jgi:secreted protein with Ig-like and vWFA domain